MVKLVDTKDLKAVGLTKFRVTRSPRQSNHPIKSHNFKITFNLNKKIKLNQFVQTGARHEHREII